MADRSAGNLKNWLVVASVTAVTPAILVVLLLFPMFVLTELFCGNTVYICWVGLFPGALMSWAWIAQLYPMAFSGFFFLFCLLNAAIICRNFTSTDSSPNRKVGRYAVLPGALLAAIYAPISLIVFFFVDNWSQLEFLWHGGRWWPIITSNNAIVHLTDGFNLGRLVMVEIYAIPYGALFGWVAGKALNLSFMRELLKRDNAR